MVVIKERVVIETPLVVVAMAELDVRVYSLFIVLQTPTHALN